MANKKSAFQKAKHEHLKKYTFIITPNTSGRTFSFSISAFWLKNLAFFVGLFAVFAVLVTVSYMGLLANYNMSKQDLVTLQSINKAQQVQLYEMNELSKEINDKLVYLNLLETEIKKMLEQDETFRGSTMRSMAFTRPAIRRGPRRRRRIHELLRFKRRYYDI
jgi:hypothetical protein